MLGTLIGSVGSAGAMVASDEELVGIHEAFWLRLLDNECPLYSRYAVLRISLDIYDRRLQREGGSFMGESSWIARRPAESLDWGGAGRGGGPEDQSKATRIQRELCLVRIGKETADEAMEM